MSLSYTQDQLVREVQLLICELSLLVNVVVQEGAGQRALGIDGDSDFAQSGHPDDLVDLQRYDIWQYVEHVQRYVEHQEWIDSLPNELTLLSLAVERVFSASVVANYEKDKLENPAPDPLPGAFEEGAGDVSTAHFYRGILVGLVSLASARLKLDKGERLTMGEIAALIGVREPTVVTNAHRKNFPTVEEGNRRYAEPADVLPWMIKNGFRPTTKAGAATEPRPTVPEDSEDVLFVPVARDGTWFSPDSRHNGRYKVGAGTNERSFADYYEALAALLRMPTPRWRTKRDGVPGIAFGVRFDRVSRPDLERSLANLVKPI